MRRSSCPQHSWPEASRSWFCPGKTCSWMCPEPLGSWSPCSHHAWVSSTRASSRVSPKTCRRGSPATCPRTWPSGPSRHTWKNSEPSKRSCTARSRSICCAWGQLMVWLLGCGRNANRPFITRWLWLHACVPLMASHPQMPTGPLALTLVTCDQRNVAWCSTPWSNWPVSIFSARRIFRLASPVFWASLPRKWKPLRHAAISRTSWRCSAARWRRSF
mmetsp:Transcript_29611/g.47864  ORF Transcript_29611/g.47864 Transcript_29611/m.47864 type:complete len:217 (-) Transcript_29611:300-950(-)